MTNLSKYTSEDMGTILNALNKYSVGLDDVFYSLHSYGVNHPGGQYPPYNIVKESNVKWRLEMALAGWSREQIKVTTESNVLIIESAAPKDHDESGEYIHRGLAYRTFTRGFNLSDDVEIGEVSFHNGLLVVELQKVIPEHQRKRTYEIVSK